MSGLYEQRGQSGLGEAGLWAGPVPCGYCILGAFPPLPSQGQAWGHSPTLNICRVGARV